LGYEAYLAAVLAEEVSPWDSRGGSARVKAARLPAVKTLDDFDLTVPRSSATRSRVAAMVDPVVHQAEVVPSRAGPTVCAAIEGRCSLDIRNADLLRFRPAIPVPL
jgi:hypothetical protein